MDREIFKEKLYTTPPFPYVDKINIISRSIIANDKTGVPRGHFNVITVTEELAELAQELTKWLRGKGDRLGILEELCDVQLGLLYIQIIMGIGADELECAMAVKLQREKERTNPKSMYETAVKAGYKDSEEEFYKSLNNLLQSKATYTEK